MAMELIRTLKELGFHFQVVLADSLDSESTDFIEALGQLELQFVLAIRKNHGVGMPAEQQIEYTAWQECDRVFTNGAMETRGRREIVYGHRHAIRYVQITTDIEERPPERPWFLMAN
jgi:SRSO17 transposase